MYNTESDRLQRGMRMQYPSDSRGKTTYASRSVQHVTPNSKIPVVDEYAHKYDVSNQNPDSTAGLREVSDEAQLHSEHLNKIWKNASKLKITHQNTREGKGEKNTYRAYNILNGVAETIDFLIAIGLLVLLCFCASDEFRHTKFQEFHFRLDDMYFSKNWKDSGAKTLNEYRIKEFSKHLSNIQRGTFEEGGVQKSFTGFQEPYIVKVELFKILIGSLSQHAPKKKDNPKLYEAVEQMDEILDFYFKDTSGNELKKLWSQGETNVTEEHINYVWDRIYGYYKLYKSGIGISIATSYDGFYLFLYMIVWKFCLEILLGESIGEKQWAGQSKLDLEVRISTGRFKVSHWMNKLFRNDKPTSSWKQRGADLEEWSCGKFVGYCVIWLICVCAVCLVLGRYWVIRVLMPLSPDVFASFELFFCCQSFWDLFVSYNPIWFCGRSQKTIDRQLKVIDTTKTLDSQLPGVESKNVIRHNVKLTCMEKITRVIYQTNFHEGWGAYDPWQNMDRPEVINKAIEALIFVKQIISPAIILYLLSLLTAENMEGWGWPEKCGFFFLLMSPFCEFQDGFCTVDFMRTYAGVTSENTRRDKRKIQSSLIGAAILNLFLVMVNIWMGVFQQNQLRYNNVVCKKVRDGKDFGKELDLNDIDKFKTWNGVSAEEALEDTTYDPAKPWSGSWVAWNVWFGAWRKEAYYQVGYWYFDRSVLAYSLFFCDALSNFLNLIKLIFLICMHDMYRIRDLELLRVSLVKPATDEEVEQLQDDLADNSPILDWWKEFVDNLWTCGWCTKDSDEEEEGEWAFTKSMGFEDFKYGRYAELT